MTAYVTANVTACGNFRLNFVCGSLVLVITLVVLGVGSCLKRGWLYSLSKEPMWRREVKNPEVPYPGTGELT